MSRNTVYWVATVLFCAVLGFSGFAHLTKQPMMVESMTQMGYPTMFMTIIGVAKLLGVAALLIPGWPLLKEWAYAGFTFNLLGALGSHVLTGDPASENIGPILFLAVGAASYVLRPDDRRLIRPTAS